MNIIKGLDRIILVIAIISIIPGFFAGINIAKDKFKTENPKYELDPSKFNWVDKSNKIIKPEPEYIFPSIWEVLHYGFISSLALFLIINFGSQGLARGIKWLSIRIKHLSIWIFKGFKD